MPQRADIGVVRQQRIDRGLQQGGQRFQIYVRKDDVGENAFALYKLLDLGDHIGVSGYLFRTRTGELSVHVEEITFLSKDLLPLPESGPSPRWRNRVG